MSAPITPRIHTLDDGEPELDSRAPAALRARRGIDYQELLRNARKRSEGAALREALRAQRAQRERARATGIGETRADASPGVHEDSRDDPLDEDSRQPFDDIDEIDDDDADLDAADDATRAARLAARAARLDAQTEPFVAALGFEQARVVELMRFVAAHVADFCSDAAVLENGNWTIGLRPHAALLPDCMLELHLSHFDVMLRFHCDTHATRQLIWRHAHVLRQQLVHLLRRLAIARDVSIEAI